VLVQAEDHGSVLRPLWNEDEEERANADKTAVAPSIEDIA
jgi:hypothetical protein